MTSDQIQIQALALPLADRISLAEALWRSIGHDLPTANEAATIEQAARRDAEMTAGIVTPLTHTEVMQAARRAIRCN